MPRKKSIKRNNKRQKTLRKSISVQKMEREWMQAPSKMVSLLDKEIRSTQKQETKLSKAIHKVGAQVKKAEDRVKSAAGKKRLKAANKKLDQAAKRQAALSKKCEVITE